MSTQTLTDGPCSYTMNGTTKTTIPLDPSVVSLTAVQLNTTICNEIINGGKIGGNPLQAIAPDLTPNFFQTLALTHEYKQKVSDAEAVVARVYSIQLDKWKIAALSLAVALFLAILISMRR